MMGQRKLILILGAVLLAQLCPSSEVPKNDVRPDETVSATGTDEISESNLNQHEEDDYYQEFLGVPMASSIDDFGVRGRPGIDFPNLAAIPITSFTCRNVKESGYFADMETKCQVFHICDGGRKMSFLCPNGTIFRQSHLICDWWFRVDCDDSQNFYEPSADTLRRDRERVKHDRFASESRESMSITTEFESPNHAPVKLSPKIQEESKNSYGTTQPLYSSNQRTTTIQAKIKSGDERNIRTEKQRKSNNQHSQVFQQEGPYVQDSQDYQKDSEHRRIGVNFRSSTSDKYFSRDRTQAKLITDDGIIRAVKQTESDIKPSWYFEQEEPIKKVPQSYDRDSEHLSTEINSRSSTSGEFISANRRIATVKGKNKDCDHEENEGQILAETSSFAGSHRRGLTPDRRLESVTFSQVTDNIPIFEIPSKEEEIDSVVTYNPSKEEVIDSVVTYIAPKHEETDSVVTYKPPKQEGIDSVVTYRPVMDLEKFLEQRREQLTKDDDNHYGKPYTGARTPPNIPLSSGPGAVHSLALYIATGGDNLLQNTPRRIEGSLKGIIPTDPIPVEQPRTSSPTQKETTPVSQKQNSRLPQFPTVTDTYKSVSFLKDTEPVLKDQSTRKTNYPSSSASTQSPLVITAPNKSYFEHSTKSPIFNQQASGPSRKVSETNFPTNSPLTKDIPYVLVTTSLTGRQGKIVNSRGKSSNVQYLPTTEFSTTYRTEKTVTDKVPLKISLGANTEPPSLDINLVTTFLPRDTNTLPIPSTDSSFKSAKKDSELVNFRNPTLSTVSKKENFQEASKTAILTTIPLENKGRISVDSLLYPLEPIEYSNTEKPTTINEAQGNSFFDKEQYFRLDKPQSTTKGLGVFVSKQFYSKTDINHKKSDSSAKKMKDYLLGNFTSEDSGLFQHINKALSETNASFSEDTMGILYKNAIESTMNEAMSIGSVTESVLAETLPTTDEVLQESYTESPSTTEDTPDSMKETVEAPNTKTSHTDTIQLTPFFKVEDGKVSSTSSKFPQDDDLSTTPSDLRELAQVFSRALSAYLEDPETFREALASVSHPPNPTLPSGILSDASENLSNSTASNEEDDEVLDFSDVQTPTTTTAPRYKSDTTLTKQQTGFYITIPFITSTHKTPDKGPNFNKQNNLPQKDAEGPDFRDVQSPTTVIPELITPSSVKNESFISSELRAENISSKTDKISLLDKELSLNEQQVSKIETTSKLTQPKPATEINLLPFEDSSYGPLSSGKAITENLPPLETDLLPPFQDPIPDQELGVDEKSNGFTEINIPTAALDEILNEFVPEELNRLAMTSIEPEEIPDNKSNYLSSYTGSLVPNSLSTYDFQNKDPSSTPSSIITSTTPISSTTETPSHNGHNILSRLTAKLPQTNQGKASVVHSQINTVSYSTYANQLLKTVINSVTEKDESLIRAQSANFLPSQPSSNALREHVSDKIPEKLTSAAEETKSSPTEDSLNEKTTPSLIENQDYEFLTSSSERTTGDNNFPIVEAQTVSNSESVSLSGREGDDRSSQGNPRLVLLFVNDHNAKGRGINEKNARLLKALLRKDDHHILRSAGLIPDNSNTRESTTSTEYNPYTITSVAPTSHTVLKATTMILQPNSGKDDAEVRTEPPITTYAPKFTIPWLPVKKARSPSRNETVKAEKLQVTEPTKSRAEETTTINTKTSAAPTNLPKMQTAADLNNTTSILSSEDKSTVSDGRAFDLLRSLYSLTARWG